MNNYNDSDSANGAKRHLKCYIHRIEFIEGEYPKIDISVDVGVGDTADKKIAELLHLGYAEVSQ
jgi:hypothetical protein